MTREVGLRRRVVLQALASLVLGMTHRGFGQSASSEAAAPDAAAPGTGAVLTVVVTGNDRRIADAAVKFTSPASDEPERVTNENGEVTLQSPVLGPATVRVIAVGWQSVLQDVVLTAGPQRLTITLKPLSNPAP